MPFPARWAAYPCRESFVAVTEGGAGMSGLITMGALPHAVHRSIFVVDVEKFGDHSRTNAHRVAVRDGFFRALRTSFARSGVPWERCRCQDCGDGAMVLVPPDVPKNLLSGSLPRELAAALEEHNADCERQARIRLRAVLHAGEVRLDDHGVVGAAVNLAFRLLESAALRSVLAESSDVLALMASEWFFQEVIRHEPESNSAAFRRVQVSVKETDTTAWACLPRPSERMPRSRAPAAGPAEFPARPEMPGQPVRLAPRPVFLAGREGLLTELDDRLGGPGPRVAALCGLGGAGKTSVAVEYAHRHLAGSAVCWQFPAGDPAVLEAEFAVLAAQLGVRNLADARDPVASVHAVLAWQEAAWLLVFDNAPDLASVERFLPPAGNGRVLITTQSQHWPPGQALQVPVLGAEAAADFLMDQAGSADRTAALELAGELGGLPLALAQAAAYMQATGISTDAYLPLFRARQADLLARGEAAGHPANVAATLGLALAELADRAPAALGLLRLLAFLAPESVPLGLLLGSENQVAGQAGADTPELLRPLIGDPVETGDAITALRCYSLASPAGDGTVLVHRLVQAVTRASLQARSAAQWEQAAATLVEAAIPADPEVPAAYPACELLLPHARTALDPAGNGMARIAEYLTASGSYPAALELWQQITDARTEHEGYGPEHPDTLHARIDLSYLIGWTGDYDSARDQYADLLPATERVLGPEHPDTLRTRDKLAYFTAAMGDFSDARDQGTSLLPVVERVLGPEHPITLRTRIDLAVFTGETGDYGSARDQCAHLLPLLGRVLGPEHPHAFLARIHLAVLTGGAGDPDRARDQYADLLPVVERVLGPEHPYTLRTRNNLALATADAGDFGDACDQYADLPARYERVFGSGHPLTLIVRDNLAVFTGGAGDPSRARDQCSALLPLLERVLGPGHVDTVIARNNLAAWTEEDGDTSRKFRAAYLPTIHAQMIRLYAENANGVLAW